MLLLAVAGRPETLMTHGVGIATLATGTFSRTYLRDIGHVNRHVELIFHAATMKILDVI
jgi:hypothetical protein